MLGRACGRQSSFTEPIEECLARVNRGGSVSVEREKLAKELEHGVDAMASKSLEPLGAQTRNVSLMGDWAVEPNIHNLGGNVGLVWIK